MADASNALGAPEVVGAWVNSSGKGKRTMNAVAFGQYGASGGIPATVETPNFGGFGYLALSATDMVLVKGKQGLVGLKLTDDVVAKVPRSEVAAIELGEGKLTAPLRIKFVGGGEWTLEVARANRKGAERVAAEVVGG
jgi:hypothetical protein